MGILNKKRTAEANSLVYVQSFDEEISASETVIKPMNLRSPIF